MPDWRSLFRPLRGRNLTKLKNLVKFLIAFAMRSVRFLNYRNLAGLSPGRSKPARACLCPIRAGPARLSGPGPKIGPWTRWLHRPLRRPARCRMGSVLAYGQDGSSPIRAGTLCLLYAGKGWILWPGPAIARQASGQRVPGQLWRLGL